MHAQTGGFISGPTQFAMADRTMRMAVLGAKGFDEMFMTNELSIRSINALLVFMFLWSIN